MYYFPSLFGVALFAIAFFVLRPVVTPPAIMVPVIEALQYFGINVHKTGFDPSFLVLLAASSALLDLAAQKGPRKVYKDLKAWASTVDPFPADQKDPNAQQDAEASSSAPTDINRSVGRRPVSA